MTETRNSSTTIPPSTTVKVRFHPEDPRYKYMQSMKSWTQAQLQNTTPCPQQHNSESSQANFENASIDDHDISNSKWHP